MSRRTFRGDARRTAATFHGRKTIIPSRSAPIILFARKQITRGRFHRPRITKPTTKCIASDTSFRPKRIRFVFYFPFQYTETIVFYYLKLFKHFNRLYIRIQTHSRALRILILTSIMHFDLSWIYSGYLIRILY